MKIRPLLFPAMCLTALAMFGCGGSGENAVSVPVANTTASRKTGVVQFAIKWPEQTSRVIPQATETIRVRLTVYDVPFADGTFVREITIPAGTQPEPITGVPVGNTKMDVSAEGTTPEETFAIYSQTIFVGEGDNSPVVNLEAASRFLNSVQRIPLAGPPVPVPVDSSSFSEFFDATVGEVYEITLAAKTFSGKPLSIPSDQLTVRVSSFSGDVDLLDLNNIPYEGDSAQGVSRFRVRKNVSDFYYFSNYIMVEVPTGLVYDFNSDFPATFYIYLNDPSPTPFPSPSPPPLPGEP